MLIKIERLHGLNFNGRSRAIGFVLRTQGRYGMALKFKMQTDLITQMLNPFNRRFFTSAAGDVLGPEANLIRPARRC